jgi:hypothetical protein
MTQEDEPWLKLCQLAAVEKDPDKLMALVKEINDLLEARERRRPQLGIQRPQQSTR